MIKKAIHIIIEIPIITYRQQLYMPIIKYNKKYRVKYHYSVLDM